MTLCHRGDHTEQHCFVEYSTIFIPVVKLHHILVNYLLLDQKVLRKYERFPIQVT